MNRIQDLQILAPEFWAEVDDALQRADALVEQVEYRERYGQMYAGNAEQALAWYEQESASLNHELGSILRLLRLHVYLAAGVLGAEAFSAEFAREWSSISDPVDIVALPGQPVLYCPALELIRDTLTALSGFLPDPKKADRVDNSSRALLERILEGTGKIVQDRGIVPNREQQVRDAIYQHLIHVFPETVREVPIAQVSKVYKADIGIRSLKTAVEYKYARTEADLRKQIGGVYEDVKGYAGSADWTTFIAVFYTAGHWLTRHQLEAEWQLVGVPHTWKPILVPAPTARMVEEGRNIAYDTTTTETG